YAHYVSFISPEIFHFNIMIIILVMVIIGSVGTVAGPVIGSILIVLLLEVLRLQDAWREPLFGIILVAATLLVPQGLTELSRQLYGRYFGKNQTDSTPRKTDAAQAGA